MSDSPERVLVVKPSSLGDIVHALPAVAMIRSRWPSARIHWLANTEWLPVLEGNPHIDRVVEFPRARFRGAWGWARFVSWAARAREALAADVVLDFQGLFRSAVVGRLARRGRLLGLSDAREGALRFYDAAADVSRETHSVGRCLALAEMAAGPPRPVHAEFVLPEGAPPPGFDLRGGFIVVHPFSRGAGKSLDAGVALHLAAAFSRRGPVVLAGRGGPPLPTTLPAGVHSFIDRTSLPELVWLMRHASATVSVDSGPMHLAAAVCPRVLGIHTWSDPARVGPFAPHAMVWQGGVLHHMRDILGGTVRPPAIPCGRTPAPAEIDQFPEAVFSGAAAG